MQCEISDIKKSEERLPQHERSSHKFFPTFVTNLPSHLRFLQTHCYSEGDSISCTIKVPFYVNTTEIEFY